MLTYMYALTDMCVNMFTHVHKYVCARDDTQTHTEVIHVCVCVCVYIYIYIYMPILYVILRFELEKASRWAAL